jgi:NAD(P)-dependent dehydrogenase (short-subunit alcohol dehydrogenase family)
LITAGASGIGLATAQAFVRAGARVHVGDIDGAALQALKAEHPAIGVSRCDVAARAEVARMMDEVDAALGGLDVLINNAGIAGPAAPVAELSPEAWDAVLRVNLTGTFTVTQLAIPLLQRSEAGCILIMSSLAGRVGYPNRSPYATTKWGLIGFTKTLSRELGPSGIRVNAILPGAVEGPRIEQVMAGRAALSGRTPAEERAAELSRQSVPHFVDPADIAELAVFLASRAGRSISGQTIAIDGDAQGTA